MEKAKIQKWQIWRQILSELPTYLHQISSDADLPKNLTSYVNAPFWFFLFPALVFWYYYVFLDISVHWISNVSKTLLLEVKGTNDLTSYFDASFLQKSI